MRLTPDRIPADFTVRPLVSAANACDPLTCGACGLSWDNAIATAYTPAPGARCPFEAFHVAATPAESRVETLRQCEDCGEVWDAEEWNAPTTCACCAESPQPAHFDSQAAHFAYLARKKWRYVQFDEKTGRGRVDWGGLGMLEFWESANDPAVILYLTPSIRFKDHAASLVGALNKIARVKTNTGL